ncbi:MAG: methyltransferase domain-containing protein [bacterium]
MHSESINNTTAYDAYFKAVMGTERARHTYLRRLETIENLAEGLEGKSVLDIGCGMGFRTAGIAKKGVKSIVGIDVDYERIRNANNFAGSLGINNISFLPMSAQFLAFPDGSFDLVIADEMIHHLEDLPAVLREVFRVIKRGGTIVISDHNKLSFFSELVRFIYFGSKREKLYSVYQIRRLFKETDFRDIRHKHILFTSPFSHTPHFLLKVNYMMEALIEIIPLLNLQCGVYVIRGVKK